MNHYIDQDAPPLFNLSIDPVTKTHLSETAKWARFLAIAGMVFMGFAVVAIIAFVVYLNSSSVFSSDGYPGANPFSNAGFSVGIAFFYVLLLLIWFFPLLFLLRFANKMKVALAGNDQQALTTSAQNLKICFRYVGIITIIILAIYAIAFVFGILGALIAFN